MFGDVVASSGESRHRTEFSRMPARRNRRSFFKRLGFETLGHPAPTASPANRSTWDMLLWNHIKLWAATIVGIGLSAVMPASWTLITRILVGWNGAILILVPLVVMWARCLNAKELRARYEEDDPTGPVILLAVVAASVLSGIAIVALLSTLKQVGPEARAAHVLLACMTIVDSWLLVHTMFTMHYADMYYSVTGDSPPPLNFPQTHEPLFWDFVYFAFTIAVACQTADVSTTQTAIRRTVTVHSVVSFVFNISILGFAVNVSAGLLGGS
jgi:uncharacterized membrane protein